MGYGSLRNNYFLFFNDSYFIYYSYLYSTDNLFRALHYILYNQIGPCFQGESNSYIQILEPI